MSFSINTNVTSLQAQANLAASSAFQSKTINRVTSGLRIVDSGDDAAGLAIANGFRSDQAVLNQGIRNANDGLSTLQTIDGGMNNISLLLDRARTLATQSASGTFTGDRTLLNSEFSSVLSEIDRQAQSVGMNSGGQFATDLTTYIGGGKDATGGSADAAAIVNGTVGVDLSHSAVDSRSLGLATFQTTAPTTAPVLSTIVLGGATQHFVFNGAGFSDANAVVVSATGMNTATTMSDVVAKINAGIATAASQVGAPAAAFKAAGIVASLSSDGKSVVFGSANSQFSVSADATGTAGAENILGTTLVGQAVSAAGAQSATLGWGANQIAGDTQQLTLTTTDTNGNQVSQQINLTFANGATKDNAIATINTALQAAGGNLAKLVAVDEDTLSGTNTGSIRILGPQNFQVQIGTQGQTAGSGVNNGIGAGLQAQNVSVTSASSGSAGAIDITTASNASQAVNALANAVATLGSAQAAVGKGENTFNYAMNLAQSQTTNLAAAESRIRDADLAAEAANLTKAQILVQAGTAALAQANSAPQAILSLLK
jgi:flagellin